ncbi:MAG: hypothetical protein KDE51_05070, partial [Anaerolineales bacterium]|nr:hypothetical protein [Anaerolineales bacterium]
SATDPDDQRRAQLLNILLLGFGAIALLAIVATLLLDAGQPQETEILLVVAGSFAVAGIAFLLWINRRGWTQTASWCFILLLIVLLTFGDVPREVVGGRTLFLFAIPILVSAVILRPQASFLVALLVDIALGAVAIAEGIQLSVVVVLGFFALALISWLSARSLEQALGELRIINQELDKRVEARTAELKITNSLLEEQIVERQRAAEVARIARDQALDASRFKTEMLAKVSHELRTPLGVILGFAEMMDAGIYGPTTDKQKDALSKIIERDKRLTQLVGDLLDQSQFESGKITLQNNPFSPQKISENIQMSLGEMAEKKGIDLLVNIDTNLPETLIGDGARVEQIMTNLVNNALKFTESGFVNLSAYVATPQEWVIEVKDSGMGIPDRAQRYIFEAFRQVDGSATRNHEGFGLGLSIVKQITDAMNGNIELESRVGKGSTFTVTLPMIPAKMQEVV